MIFAVLIPICLYLAASSISQARKAGIFSTNSKIRLVISILIAGLLIAMLMFFNKSN